MTKKSALSETLLLRLSGDRSFGRGKAYFVEGRVEGLLVRERTVTATVEGSRRYRVRFELGSGGIEEHDCSCPMGDDGDFCKHCVAVGLALLQEGVEAPKGKGKRKVKPAGEKPPTWEDVAAHVRAMPQGELAGLVLEAAKKEDGLYRRLVRATAAASGSSSAAAACRAELANAFTVDGFVDYHEAWGFAQGMEDAVDSLEALLKSGAASECIELAEFAFERLDRAVGRMDDSDGESSVVAEKLSEIHLTACKTAKPDPEVLAARLFELELADEWGWWDHTVRAYAPVLGKRGVAAFRRLAEAQWTQVPARGPGTNRGAFDGRRSTLQGIMEDLAELDGDVDALVAIKSRDLSSSYAYGQIVATLEQARRHEEAVTWAEKGVRAFPDTYDAELPDFLAVDYLKKGRSEDAMALIWRQFEPHPNLEVYQKLHTFAARAKAWPRWREKALSHLRADLDRRGKAKPKPWDRRADASTLVEIFLWEKDAEAAWAEAQAGGCSGELWLKLAKLREKDHPAEAVPVYQKLVEAHAGRKTNHDYAEAAALVKRIRELLNGLDRKADFATYLTQVRLRHRPKRNFMKALDRAL
jgi:tetratricopeptide (TPR) repeat protein